MIEQAKVFTYYLRLIVVLLLVIINHKALCRSSSSYGESNMEKCQPHYHNKHDMSRMSCECTKKHCDNLVFDWPQPGQALRVSSNKLGRRFFVEFLSSSDNANKVRFASNLKHCMNCGAGHRNSTNNAEKSEIRITLDLSKQYQSILGWGGALTDASLMNTNSLSEEMQLLLMENYFGINGLRYNFARVPIASSDFSSHTYSYDDVEEPDYEQKHWKLAVEDTQLKMPYIKLAKNLTAYWNGDLKLFASSWSPPEWMKTNHKFVRGFLIGPSSAEGKTYKAYARYLLNFLDAYKEHNISLWGMTLQNEPGSAYLPFYYFNSLEFSPSKQIDFIKYHLGPMLEENGYNKSNFKLIVGDDSIGIANIQIDKILSDISVRKYISGIGLHWYLKGLMPYSLIDRLYENHKDHIEFMLSTEACTGSMPYEPKVILGDWDRGVSYAKDIIEDLNRNVNGWIDWNIALDMNGGPNWANNFVDSPIIVDYLNDKFYKNPMYYVLGHFSRFIPPGSKRIQCNLISTKNNGFDISLSSDYTHTNHFLMSTAFILPSSKHISLVLLNLSDNSKQITVDILRQLIDNDMVSSVDKDDRIDDTIDLELLPSSITTLVYGI